jgi:hypothetical protein
MKKIANEIVNNLQSEYNFEKHKVFVKEMEFYEKNKTRIIKNRDKMITVSMRHAN